jgi:hypothetical protein
LFKHVGQATRINPAPWQKLNLLKTTLHSFSYIG